MQKRIVPKTNDITANCVENRPVAFLYCCLVMTFANILFRK